jgi:cytochrome c-type biogenesis protein CcmH
MRLIFLAIYALLFIPSTYAQYIIESDRERDLLEEIRCLVCQNQSLADSQAPLAIDLKREVRLLIKEGYRDEEIFNYLTDRYGDFVLYKPRLSAVTLLLWTGPFLMLFIAILALIRILRQSARYNI